MGRARTSRGRAAQLVPLQKDYPEVASELASDAAGEELRSKPFLDGDVRFLDAQTIAGGGGTTQYRHDLGRTIRGWIITRINNAGGALDGFIHETAADKETLTLQNDATNDVDVAIAVY